MGDLRLERDLRQHVSLSCPLAAKIVVRRVRHQRFHVSLEGGILKILNLSEAGQRTYLETYLLHGVLNCVAGDDSETRGRTINNSNKQPVVSIQKASPSGIVLWAAHAPSQVLGKRSHLTELPNCSPRC